MTMDFPPVPHEREWINVETGDRIHPYEMYRIASVDFVEVINSETDENETIKRYVVLRDGEYEVWVEASAKDAFGYERQPDERVSEAEREAIALKCETVKTDRIIGAEPTVSFSDAALRLTDELDSDDPKGAMVEHLLVATYYAAKQDPGFDDQFVVEIRNLVQEHTSHVDTGRPEVLRDTLGVVADDDLE